ncbi:MAG: hypothetical protein AB7I27_17130 [Bacteriovoracaceae bacterium]
MKTLLLSFFLIQSLHAEPARPSRWQELMRLVSEEMRILENARRKGPELQYRMLELHSERLKLLHEKNNADFLKASKASKVANKEVFFTETRIYYQKTKDFGHKLLKDYPNNPRLAEIYFALGLNSRDYGRDQITEKYLLHTISLVSNPSNALRHHAETALADFYYNEKRYQDAVKFYQKVIKKKEDEWLTKHLFNLSWCFLKIREFDRAIETIKDSYHLSKNTLYINMRDQALENIGSFYVYAGRPLEGLDFYLKNEAYPVPYLISMSLKASQKGHEKETEAILLSAQKIIDKTKNYESQEELYHTVLDFFRHYNRFADHERFSAILVNYYGKAEAEKELKLKAEMKEDAIEKMRSTAGFLQVKLAKDIKKDEGEFKAEELKLVLNYFDHLMVLDLNKKIEYLYFRAETYYSVRLFEKAAFHYEETVNEAKRTKNDEFARKSLNSLLALTAQEVLPTETNKKYLTLAYREHLQFWPRDEKSEQIYPKLFSIYLENKDDMNSAATLRAFNKNYPEHLNQQQELMTKLLDQFIDQKATQKIASWIHEFKNGFLSFDKSTIEKTEIVLGNMLFLEYQEMAKKGDKYSAAKGFENIYVNKLYTDKVKSQSAFFAALAYLEMGETATSFYWQTLAYGRMTHEEKLERREEQLKIAERMYKMQDFVTSFKLSNMLLKEFCSLKDKTQDRLFEVAVMTSLVEEKPKDTEQVLKEFSHCLKDQELKDKALSQIYRYFEKRGDFFGLRSFIGRHYHDPYKKQYSYTLQKWFWEKSSLNLKSQIKEEFKVLKQPETLEWLKEIEKLVLAQKAQEELLESEIWKGPVFDGDKFNTSLEKYLGKVKQFKDQYFSLTESEQIDLSILSTRLFIETYDQVSRKIMALNPNGMDAETKKAFSLAMRDVALNFKKNSNQFDGHLKSALKQKESLAWGQRSIASVEKVENPIFSFFTGLTMDKTKE